MGIKNVLIEGVSGSGKTSVCDELSSRGYESIHGDRILAYKGDPKTGEPVSVAGHEWHIWDIEKVKALVADKSNEMTFFCGGSRNFHHFIHLFDAVFVLEVDRETLKMRLDMRPEGEWGHLPEEQALVMQLHESEEDIPQSGLRIDATRPLSDVVDEIIQLCETLSN